MESSTSGSEDGSGSAAEHPLNTASADEPVQSGAEMRRDALFEAMKSTARSFRLPNDPTHSENVTDPGRFVDPTEKVLAEFLQAFHNANPTLEYRRRYLPPAVHHATGWHFLMKTVKSVYNDIIRPQRDGLQADRPGIKVLEGA